MKANQNNVITDTIPVIHYCGVGAQCPNHKQGITDTTYTIYQFVGTEKTYFETNLPPYVDEKGVSHNKVIVDIFGNVMYFDEEEFLDKSELENSNTVQLTSFDTIKVSTNVYAPCRKYIPKYHNQSEIIQNTTMNNNDMVFDAFCFPVLILITVNYIFRCLFKASWAKLKKDVFTA